VQTEHSAQLLLFELRVLFTGVEMALLRGTFFIELCTCSVVCGLKRCRIFWFISRL